MAHDPRELEARIRARFPATDAAPSISLRAGNALDEYREPPPFDLALDRCDAAYIERFHWGIHFLDPDSWLHYLPELLLHALREMSAGESSALDTFLFSLRPPDRDPPRFTRLSAEQHAVVVDVLEAIGFSPDSRYQEEALEALQEYWLDAR